MDLAAVPVLKEHTALPVIVDPSHAAGRRNLVTPLSIAAVRRNHRRGSRTAGRGDLRWAAALAGVEFANYLERVERAAALAGKLSLGAMATTHGSGVAVADPAG